MSSALTTEQVRAKSAELAASVVQQILAEQAVIDGAKNFAAAVLKVRVTLLKKVTDDDEWFFMERFCIYFLMSG